MQDIVVKQQQVHSSNGDIYTLLETQKGYNLEMKYQRQYEGKHINFHVSPLFKYVVKFENPKSRNNEPVKNGYLGIYAIFKILALLAMLISSIYIFYYKGSIPFVDLSLFLLFPLFINIVAFYIFNK